LLIPSIGVLKDAEHIAYNAIDVAISMYGTRDAATQLHKAMRERKYSTHTWSEHELHPKLGVDVDEIGLLNFIFTMDLLRNQPRSVTRSSIRASDGRAITAW
jgi:hypothetical protein